jgi:flagellar biosynthesis/type III secretory pathway protein FliH
VSVPGLPRPRVLKAGTVADALAAGAGAAEAERQARHRAELEQAYAEGVAAGRAAAAAEGAAVGPRAAAALERLAEEVTRQGVTEIDAADEAVRRIALDVTEWVLRGEPSQASATLLSRLSTAARALAPAPTAVVRCSLDDLELVQGWARDGVEVVGDARLAAGEARLDRGAGSAVLTFNAALRRAAEALGVTR